jgi:hypothetical protein
LIDWENASEGMSPFYDLFHFLVQASAELRRPTKRAIVTAIQLKGRTGCLVEAYAEGSQCPPGEAQDWFVAYLRQSGKRIEPGAPRRAARIRGELHRMVA